MSDLQRRIAELAGWTNLCYDEADGKLLGLPPDHSKEDLEDGYLEAVPNWPTDLTLAWQLEDELKGKEMAAYVDQLGSVVFKEDAIENPPTYSLIHATAAQRGEAWCRLKESNQ